MTPLDSILKKREGMIVLKKIKYGLAGKRTELVEYYRSKLYKRRACGNYISKTGDFVLKKFEKDTVLSYHAEGEGLDEIRFFHVQDSAGRVIVENGEGFYEGNASIRDAPRSELPWASGMVSNTQKQGWWTVKHSEYLGKSRYEQGKLLYSVLLENNGDTAWIARPSKAAGKLDTLSYEGGKLYNSIMYSDSVSSTVSQYYRSGQIHSVLRCTNSGGCLLWESYTPEGQAMVQGGNGIHQEYEDDGQPQAESR
jgi:hypothetical protein